MKRLLVTHPTAVGFLGLALLGPALFCAIGFAFVLNGNEQFINWILLGTWNTDLQDLPILVYMVIFPLLGSGVNLMYVRLSGQKPILNVIATCLCFFVFVVFCMGFYVGE